MDYVWLLEQIFITVIIPLLGVLTIFIIKCVNSYSEKLQAETDNELTRKYIGLLNDVIRTCVIATNQTYVNSLKTQGRFDIDAQKQAFEMTYNAVLEILSEEMMSILSTMYEDLDQYIKNQIELMVNTNKETFFNQQPVDTLNYNYN